MTIEQTDTRDRLDERVHDDVRAAVKAAIADAPNNWEAKSMVLLGIGTVLLEYSRCFRVPDDLLFNKILRRLAACPMKDRPS